MQLTQAYIRDVARREVQAVKESSGHPAKLAEWRLLVEDRHVSLIVLIHSSSGLRSRQVAM